MTLVNLSQNYANDVEIKKLFHQDVAKYLRGFSSSAAGKFARIFTHI